VAAAVVAVYVVVIIVGTLGSLLVFVSSGSRHWGQDIGVRTVDGSLLVFTSSGSGQGQDIGVRISGSGHGLGSGHLAAAYWCSSHQSQNRVKTLMSG